MTESKEVKDALTRSALMSIAAGLLFMAAGILGVVEAPKFLSSAVTSLGTIVFWEAWRPMFKD